MNCTEARPGLIRHLYGEPGAPALEQHLSECAECVEVLQSMADVRAAYRAGPAETLPPALRAQARSLSSPLRFLAPVSLVAAALLTIAALAFMGTARDSRDEPTDPPASAAADRPFDSDPEIRAMIHDVSSRLTRLEARQPRARTAGPDREFERLRQRVLRLERPIF